MKHFDYHHATGESELVDLPADQVKAKELEYAAWLEAKKLATQEKAERETLKAQALAKLGLSEDELKAILS